MGRTCSNIPHDGVVRLPSCLAAIGVTVLSRSIR